MTDNVRCDNETHYFFNPNPGKSSNGLYIIRMGETFPNPDYRIERFGTTSASLGGLFVLEYVISGAGYIECDGVTRRVSDGDFYFLNRGFSHCYYPDRKDPFRKIWINCAGPFVAGLAVSLGIREGVWVAHFDAEQYFRRIQSILSSAPSRNGDRIYDQIALIVTDLFLSAAYSQRRESSAEEDVLYEIKRFMDSEVNLRATLDEICTLFYQNKSYLIYRFRREFGITPHKYMLDRKMVAAREMLSSSSMQIKEISALLGFANPQYFSSAFKSDCGMTPLEYREKVSAADDQRKK